MLSRLGSKPLAGKSIEAKSVADTEIVSFLLQLKSDFFQMALLWVTVVVIFKKPFINCIFKIQKQKALKEIENYLKINRNNYRENNNVYYISISKYLYTLAGCLR